MASLFDIARARDASARTGSFAPASLLPDAERQELLVLAGVFQRVAGLIEEVRDVDSSEGVGTLHDQYVSRLRLAERLPGAQRRQRAFKAAQIERLFGHFTRES